MRILITENQLRNLLLENDNEEFNFDEMLKLNSYKKRIDYCRRYLTFLGKGSSRMAFKLNNEKVLKIAINKKGVEQNRTEIKSYNEYYKDILAIIYNFSKDDNGVFLEMELARKPKLNDFERLIGFNLHEISSFLIYMYENSNHGYMEIPEDIEDIINDLSENDFIYNLLYFINDNQINPRDFTNRSQWGIVIRNNKEHLVIVDYGYSEDVKKMY